MVINGNTIPIKVDVHKMTMPPELRKAHQQNDFAVMSFYIFSKNMTENEISAEL